MAPPPAAVAAIGVVAVIFVVGTFAYSLFSQKEENYEHKEFPSNNRPNNYNDEPDSASDNESIRLSNLNHDHDHQKVKHPSKARANDVIRSMRNSGKYKKKKKKKHQRKEFPSNNRRNKHNDEPESESDSDYESIRLSNLHKNHDHQKVKHPSEARANAVILRMRNSGKDKNHKLRSYYNSKLIGWFVGNSKYD